MKRSHDFRISVLFRRRFFCFYFMLTVGATAAVDAREIQFVEGFALSSDREATLQQLIPGTEDYYYYHCLHYQNTEQYDRVETTIQAWIKRYNYTARVREILNRQAVLTFEKNPQKSLDYIQKQLGIRFDHTRPRIDSDPRLPKQLDPQIIDQDRLTNRAMQNAKNLSGFHDTALQWLAERSLTPIQRRDLLSRLQRPDVPGMVKLVADDLKYKGSRGFGSLAIHKKMLLSQLQELAKLQPKISNERNFVNIYLTKLAPNDDINWQYDPEAKRDYIRTLWQFVSSLAPAHNSLKVHVLYHWLSVDEKLGKYDRAKFLQYIKLPRNAPYVNREYLRRPDSRRFVAQLNENFESVTKLAPVANDQLLVRRYLQHFFVADSNTRQFAPFLDSKFLTHLFAETKIVNGLGDPEQWYSMLPPNMYQQLKERVDLEFSPSNRQTFGRDDSIGVDLHLKNIQKLIVKVYEINTKNFFRQNLREINTDVNLDGLVANFEQTHEYDFSPVLRKEQHFEFAHLNQPGVYVIDFIGNGKSSRVVVRKGRLHYLHELGRTGHILTIVDEVNRPVSGGGSIWMSGREYVAGDDGRILLPYSTRPQNQGIVLSDGTISSFARFRHAAEKYNFTAGFLVNRESLVAQQNATLLIRPGLQVNGVPIDPAMVEEVALTIEAVDHDGVKTTTTVGDLEFKANEDTTYDLRVPDRLASISFQVSGKMKSLSTAKDVRLSASREFQVNSIERTAKIEDLYLSRYGQDYWLEVLGRTGEPKENRPVRIKLNHRDFRSPIQTSLQTNGDGRISLGKLPGVVSITAVGSEETQRTWRLLRDETSLPSAIHVAEGEEVVIPYAGEIDQVDRSEFSLLELRGETFVADRLDRASAENGFLRISDLPAGDYDLSLKATGKSCRIRVARGPRVNGYVLGSVRFLEVRNEQPLHIVSVTPGEKDLSIQLANASNFSRVHVVATRFVPSSSPFDALGFIRDAEPVSVYRQANISLFAEGRDIGDEYRYILDRQYLTKYPGNMLRRPSLLLNPWELRSTENSRQEAAVGDAEFEAADDAAAAPAQNSASRRRSRRGQGANFTSFDFFKSASPAMLNLRPDEQGIVRVDTSQLGGRQHIHVLAVDPLVTTYRSLSLNQSATPYQDRRMHDGFDPESHFTQQQKVTTLPNGGQFVVNDITTAKFERFDSLRSVFDVFRTLSKNETLREFEFVTRWHQLDLMEKKDLYGQYGCHELNFFCFEKDREFFDGVIRPYLSNKRERTLVDRYLLGEDLSRYFQPWHFERLNAFEKTLLAKRLEKQRSGLERHLSELTELIPVDRGRGADVFETSLYRDRLSRLSEERELMRGRSLQLRNESRALKESFQGGRFQKRLARPSFGRDSNKSEAPQAAAESVEEAAGDLFARPSDAFFAAPVAGGAAASLYQALESTKEWAENQYYRVPKDQDVADLIPVNAFWRDYVKHHDDKPFLSKNWNRATSSFSEMMMALAVLDLPFEAEKPQMAFEGPKLKMNLAGPTILLHEQIGKTSAPAESTPILVSQNIFQADDRFEVKDGKTYDKFVTSEFVSHTVYGCQVIVTNPSSSQQDLDVLLQIPDGSIPVAGAKATRTVRFSLQPYQTKQLDYQFYFPEAGDFDHFPAHISSEDQLLAAAKPMTFRVVKTATKIDRESWPYIAANGSEIEVIEFLKSHNIQKLDLGKIAFRMHNKGFFTALIDLLSERHVYHATLWSYGIKHQHRKAILQYLSNTDAFVSKCGAAIDSKILTIDPVERHVFQHLEYWPLVNARVHQLGDSRQILNNRFFAQYHHLMRILTCRRQLTSDDRMAVTYYLLLQDRIEEASEVFGRIKSDDLNTRIQYEYFAAYLDCFDTDTQVAEMLAAKHANHPVPRWRNAFRAIQSMVAEVNGSSASVVDENDRNQSQLQLASAEPTFDFRVEDKTITLEHQNIAKAHVNFYLMDLELLFSRSPFVKSYGRQFANIRPNHSQEIDLDEDTTHVQLPDKLHNQNILVEISSSGKTKAIPYYSNSLKIDLMENYGHLRVSHRETGRPLPTTYVKVYAEMADGTVAFYKDGYTDLRGRFDYSSLSTNELNRVSRFALLISSERHGAIVREAAPPQQ